MRLLVFCFVILFSCQKQDQHLYPRIIVPEQKNVIKVNSREMLKYEFSYYSRFFPRNFDSDYKLTEKGYSKDYVFFENPDTIFPKYHFKIIVDTSYTIPTKGFEYKHIPIPKKEGRIEDGLINGKRPTQKQIEESAKKINQYCDKQYRQWNDYVNCYPLLVFNDEKNPAYIKEIRLIQEAKDIDGKWKPIEYYYNHGSCFKNQYFFKFKPQKYFSFPIIKYFGNFKTKLRVKVKINGYDYYSNEFVGCINTSQFGLVCLEEFVDFLHPNLKNQNYYQEEIDYYLLKGN